MEKEAITKNRVEPRTRDANDSLTFHVVLHNRAATHLYLIMSPSYKINMTIQNIRRASGATVTDASGIDVTSARAHSTSIENGTILVAFTNYTSYTTQITIKATEYREFDIVIPNKSNIKALYTPSFFSRWKMDMLVNCTNLEVLFARGRVVKSGSGCGYTDTQYLSGCSNLKNVRIESNPEIKMDINDFKGIHLEAFHLLPRGFDFPNGESYVLDIDNFATNPNETNNLINSFKTLTVAGSYSIPLRGVTGTLDSFEDYIDQNSQSLETIEIRYTSVERGIIDLTGVSLTFQHNGSE